LSKVQLLWSSDVIFQSQIIHCLFITKVVDTYAAVKGRIEVEEWKQEQRQCSRNNNSDDEWLFLLAFLLSATTIGQNNDNDNNASDGAKDDATPESEWNLGYPNYPQYGSTLEQMTTHDIPVLPDQVFSATTGEEISKPDCDTSRPSYTTAPGRLPLGSFPVGMGIGEIPKRPFGTAPWWSGITTDTSQSLARWRHQCEFSGGFDLFVSKEFRRYPESKSLGGDASVGTIDDAKVQATFVYVGNMLRETYLYWTNSMDHPERMRLYEIPQGSKMVDGK
jgi:hypothetical protein